MENNGKTMENNEKQWKNNEKTMKKQFKDLKYNISLYIWFAINVIYVILLLV